MISKYNILLVDDEKEFRETLKDILEFKGYTVSTAGDGAAAVDMVMKNQYNLVIIDVRMPHMDGITALHNMLKVQPKLPVITVTAYRLIGNEEQLVKEKAKALFAKPFNIDLFLATVDKVLRK